MDHQSADLIMRTVSAEVLVNSKPDYSGTVQKKNNAGKFQYRYCIVHKGIFYYFEDWKSKKPRGYFSLAGYRAIRSVENNEMIFVLKNQDDRRTYIFSAGSNRELNEWLEKLNMAIDKYHPTQSPFYNPYTGNSPFSNACGSTTYGSTAYGSTTYGSTTYGSTTYGSNANLDSEYSRDPHPFPPRGSHPLKRSPSITSSTSSNSTSSSGSVRSHDDNFSLQQCPIYEEVPKDQRGEYSNNRHGEEPEPFFSNRMDDVDQHYQHPPNPYNVVNPRYQDPRSVRDPRNSLQAHRTSFSNAQAEEEEAYVRINNLTEDDTYVSMINTVDDTTPIRGGTEQEGYEDMNPDKYNDIINNEDNDYEIMTGIGLHKRSTIPRHSDVSDGDVSIGYEDMGPEKYHQILSAKSSVDSYASSSGDAYLDLTPDNDLQSDLEPSTNEAIVEFSKMKKINDIVFNYREVLPPHPPWREGGLESRPSPLRAEAPTPPPRPRKIPEDNFSALSISNNPPALQPPKSPALTPPKSPALTPLNLPVRPKQRGSIITYQVTEFTPPPRPGRPETSPVPPRRSIFNLQNQEVNVSQHHNRELLPAHIFKPNFEKEMCSLCLHHEKAGAYLIRTNRADGNDALAVRCESGEVKHYIIFHRNDKYYLKKDEPAFDRVADLICYYYDNNLPTVNLYLTGPMQKR